MITGERTDDPVQIKRAAVEHFVRQFSVDNIQSGEELIDIIPHIISHQQNGELMTPPSVEEVHQAVLDIPLDGAAGPDGFSAAFYISCWNIVAQDIHQAAIHIFKGGFFPEQRMRRSFA